MRKLKPAFGKQSDVPAPKIEIAYPVVPCGFCRKPFEKTRRDRMFCSASCKNRAYNSSHNHGSLGKVVSVDGVPVDDVMLIGSASQLRRLVEMAEKAQQEKDLDKLIEIGEIAKKALQTGKFKT
jgi:hypothetical protein